MKMKIVIDDEILKEIDTIIDKMPSKFPEIHHLDSLAFCIQAVKDARDNLKNEYENYNLTN
jgi:hypothetical protein